MIRRTARAIVNALGVVVALPCILWARLGMALGTEWTYSSAAYALAPIPGLPGIAMRRAFYCLNLTACRWDFTTHFGTVVTHPTARIGRNVWIGAYSLIGRCCLGDDVIIASRVSILSGRRPHRFDDPEQRIQDQQGEFVEVRIGQDCWLGEGSIIMADLGRGVVVGAGSVVVKPVPDFAIVAGNPARHLGTRGE